MERHFLLAMVLVFVPWETFKWSDRYIPSQQAMNRTSNRHTTGPDISEERSTGAGDPSPLYTSAVLYNRIAAVMQYDNATNLFHSQPVRILQRPRQMLQGLPRRERLLVWSRIMLLSQPGVMALLTTVIPGSWLIDQNVQENLELFHSGYPVIDHKVTKYSETSASIVMVVCSASVNTTTLRPGDFLECTQEVAHSMAQEQQTRAAQDKVYHTPKAFRVTARETITDLVARNTSIYTRLWQWMLMMLSTTTHVVKCLVFPWRMETLGMVQTWLSVLYQDYPLLVSLIYIKAYLKTMTLHDCYWNFLSLAYAWSQVLLRVEADTFPEIFIMGLVSALRVMPAFVSMFSGLMASLISLAVDTFMLSIPGVPSIWGLLYATKLTHCYLALSCCMLAWDIARPGRREREGNTEEPANNQPPVPLVGEWPRPLIIPDCIEELPVSELPRGFICPITQSIMRQPAMLIHEGITSFTYEKESIEEWLRTHSTDPRSNAALDRSALRLTYNMELAQNIEEWVARKHQELMMMAAQQNGLVNNAMHVLRRSGSSIRRHIQEAAFR